MPAKAACRVTSRPPTETFQLLVPKLVVTLARAADSVSGRSVPGVAVA